jgi:hypothetical protein
MAHLARSLHTWSEDDFARQRLKTEGWAHDSS